MSELLFEGYRVPSVSYAVDSLASFYQSDQKDGLIISSSTMSTHIIPVLDGKGVLGSAKRCVLRILIACYAISCIAFQNRVGRLTGCRLSTQASSAQIPQLSYSCDASASYRMKTLLFGFHSMLIFYFTGNAKGPLLLLLAIF